MGVCGLIFDRRGHKCRELRCFRRYRGASRRARSVSQLAERFVVEMPVRIVVAVSGKHNDALLRSVPFWRSVAASCPIHPSRPPLLGRSAPAANSPKKRGPDQCAPVILLAGFKSSNPLWAARQSSLRGIISRCVRTPATFPRVRLARPSLWSVIFGISALAGKVSGAGLCSPFSNFRLAVAETGSIADRDRFAGRPSGIRRTPARSPQRRQTLWPTCDAYLERLCQAIARPRSTSRVTIRCSAPARSRNRAEPWRGR
jgi:hypothetical protein